MFGMGILRWNKGIALRKRGFGDVFFEYGGVRDTLFSSKHRRRLKISKKRIRKWGNLLS